MERKTSKHFNNTIDVFHTTIFIDDEFTNVTMVSTSRATKFILLQ